MALPSNPLGQANPPADPLADPLADPPDDPPAPPAPPVHNFSSRLANFTPTTSSEIRILAGCSNFCNHLITIVRNLFCNDQCGKLLKKFSTVLRNAGYALSDTLKINKDILSNQQKTKQIDTNKAISNDRQSALSDAVAKHLAMFATQKPFQGEDESEQPEEDEGDCG